MMLVMAGAVGVPPDGFTFRELYTMYMARGRQEWDRTLAIVSMVYSVAPFDKEELDFNAYNPFRAQAEKKMQEAPFSMLKDVFESQFPRPHGASAPS